jgi:hypothetical protein
VTVSQYVPSAQVALVRQPSTHIELSQIRPLLQRVSVSQPATHLDAVVSQICSLAQFAFVRQPVRQVLVVVSQTCPDPLQSVSLRQPVWQTLVVMLQILPAPHAASVRQPARHIKLSQMLPALQTASVRQPTLHARLSQIFPLPQAASVRQPVKQTRLVVSQMRPVLHSVSDVQPTLQEVVARSQYVSLGHGQLAGTETQAPSTQTWLGRHAVQSLGPPASGWGVTPASSLGVMIPLSAMTPSDGVESLLSVQPMSPPVRRSRQREADRLKIRITSSFSSLWL